MTITLAKTKSKDGNIECTVEYEKFGCYQAFVYEKRCDYNWCKIHRSHYYNNENKAIQAYRRFVKKYIND